MLAIKDIQGDPGFKRLRPIENPAYVETPGPSSSSAPTSKVKRGRPVEKERGDVPNFISIGMSTTLKTFNIEELEEQLLLRELDFDESMDKNDMIRLLRAFDK